PTAEAPPPDPSVVQSGHALPPFPELREELARQLPGLQSADAAGPAHAPDYGWLTGELQYVAVRNAWRLRYGSAADEDRSGGRAGRRKRKVGALRDSGKAAKGRPPRAPKLRGRARQSAALRTRGPAVGAGAIRRLRDGRRSAVDGGRSL